MKYRGFYNRFVKRLLDFFISLIAILVLSPVILVVYLMSLIILRGNPIFKQYRPGKNQKVFPLYKFRSMTNKKDKDGNLLPDKDRMTGWGKFLRKSNLDELPQLFNILLGHMSIVGPRPRMVEEVVFLDETQQDRFLVRPGITGWAQVNGRNSITFDTVVKFDKEYVEKVSLLFDIKILFKTVGYVLGKGKADVNKAGTVSNEFYGDYLLRTEQISQEYYDERLALAKEKLSSANKNAVFIANNKIAVEKEEDSLPEGEADISVLMSVYKNDKPEWLVTSIESVVNQTLKPREILLFVDGPVGEELDRTIVELDKKYDILRVSRNEENIGLGRTLEKGLLECKYEIVARMDSDDYSIPTRFAEEYKAIMINSLDLVGSDVSEFIDSIDNIVAHKTVPAQEAEILKYAKTRCPFNHPTVMFRKSKILEVGGYQEMRLCEDYYLWVRLLQGEARVANINKSLVLMRVSPDLYARRGGLKYYKSQKQLLKYMKKTKFIGFFTYVKSKFIRFTVQVLMPNKLRQKLYVKMLRKG